MDASSPPADPSLDPAKICTLPPKALEARIAWIRDEILPRAHRRERLAAGLAWELDGAPGLAEKIDRLIALERECCSDVVFERMPSATPGRIRMEVRGIDPASELFRRLDVPPAPARSRARRAVAAAGIGLLTSVFVCCVLPLLAAVALGALATPLAALDGPVPIALGAIVAAGGAWWRLGRRDGAARRGSCGCAHSVSS